MRDLLCMIGLVAIFLVWNSAVGEIIPLGDGLGVDGIEYARITLEAPQVLDHGLGPLYAARILPSLVVRLLIEGTGLELDNRGVIRGFEILNGFLMLASVLLWLLLADAVGLGASGRWLGFLALFVNCGLMEVYHYYPVLTDISAFFLSLLMLWAHLRRRLVVLFLATLAGSFTWPTLLYLGLVLFLFPYRRQAAVPANPLGPRLVGVIAASGVTAGLAYGALTGYREGLSGEWAEPGLWGYGLLAFGCGLVVLYAYGAGRFLSDQRAYFERPMSYLTSGFWPRLVLAAGLYLAVDYVSGLFLAESEALEGRFLVGSVMRASQRPFVSYVMHVGFFGPVVILAAYHWRGLVALLHRHGLGITLYGSLSAVLLIQPLSRQSLSALPLLAMLVALVFERQGRFSRGELWGLAGLSLLMSRFWMPVNRWQERWPVDDDPLFWFRINQSKYFSDRVFWPQLVVVALLTLVMVLYLRRRVAALGSHRVEAGDLVDAPNGP